MSSAKNKSKPITTSVPSFAIRFHANGEEIEELYPSEEEDKSEKIEEKLEKSSTEEKCLENSGNTESNKHESSPMRDYLNKLSKRSSSIDTGINETTLGQQASSDPWRIFSEFRGKFTKTVEEKLSEIKSKNSEGDSPKLTNKAEKNKSGGSKDNSSISDSEDHSFSESFRLSSTAEDLEMSSDDENSLAESEKTPTENVAKDISHESSSMKNVLRHRLKPKSYVQFSAAKETDTEGQVKITSLLSTVPEKETLVNDDEVESGVEACEELNITISSLQKECETLLAPSGFIDTRFISSKPPNNTRLRLCYISLFILFIIICFFLPLPTFLSGFLLGCFVASAICLLYVYFKLNFKFETKNKILQQKQETNHLNILQIPTIKEHQPLTKFEGWMNEYPELYDPRTYHIMKTQSVFMKLENSVLRISHTCAKIPKRAMWDEPSHKVTFTKHRIYNLRGSQVTLLPTGLIHKRLWSKKYPICIILNKEKMNLDLNIDRKDDEIETDDDIKIGKKNKDDSYADLLVEQADETNITETDQSQLPEEEKEVCSESFSDPVLEEDKDENSIITEDWDTLTLDESTAVETKIYLFARTCRDKEDWYRRLVIATRDPSTNIEKTTEDVQIDNCNENFDLNGVNCSTPSGNINATQDVTESDINNEELANKHKTFERDDEEDYAKFMARFNQVQKFENKLHVRSPKRKFFSIRKKKHSHDDEESEEKESDVIHDNNLWLNAIVTRIIYDVCKHEQIMQQLQSLIQKKISTIKLPYFIETIVMSDLSLGKTSPVFQNIYEPVMDERGLWIYMDITYEGVISMAIVTKLNLMKLKEQAGKLEESFSASTNENADEKSPMFHSDVEDSAESSDDESSSAWILQSVNSADGSQISTPRKPNTGSKKFLQMVDKIASSKYFQQATENKYIKRAMEGVSKKEIKLTVEVQYLSGTLAINIPPPPTDRMWIGFKGNPELQLAAHPTFGERSINFLYVSRWIEKKLAVEFQKFLVIPNMEDFVLPFLIPKLPQ